jgi:hypothetical protein
VGYEKRDIIKVHTGALDRLAGSLLEQQRRPFEQFCPFHMHVAIRALRVLLRNREF